MELDDLLQLTKSKIKQKKKAVLASICENLDLDTDGKKSVLVERIWDHLEEERNKPDEPEPSENEVNEESGEEQEEGEISKGNEEASTAPEETSPDSQEESPPEVTKEADPESATEEEPTQEQSEPVASEKMTEESPEEKQEEPEEGEADPMEEESEPVEAETMETEAEPKETSEEVTKDIEEAEKDEKPVAEPPAVQRDPDVPEQSMYIDIRSTQEKESDSKKTRKRGASEDSATSQEKESGEINNTPDEEIESKGIRITGFKRPVSERKVETMIKKYGKRKSFWMNSKKTDALVEYEDSQSSKQCVEELHETYWPPDLERHHAGFLKVTYADVDNFEDIKREIKRKQRKDRDRDRREPRSPLNRGSSRDRRDRRSSRTSSRKERIESIASEITVHSPKELKTRKRKRDENNEETIQDRMKKKRDLVQKQGYQQTKAKPPIFWKALTDQEVIENRKRKRRLENRSRGGLDRGRFRRDRRRAGFRDRRRDRSRDRRGRDYYRRRDDYRRDFRRDRDRRDRRDRYYRR